MKEKINLLKLESIVGPDAIGPRLLKELADGLALVTIDNISMAIGEVPMDWKDGMSHQSLRRA